MANINATIRAKIETPTTPTIYKLDCVLADSDYTQALNLNTKLLMVRVRVGGDLKMSFAGSPSSNDWLTIPRGTSLTIDSINFSGSLYFQASKAGTIVEIMEWV